ncbi:uncharacterized protein TNCV_1510601 [Trichonephila clavipes]|nr:uncharacterized protein TNCV_1510601 [Trichonephila clavipes]
MLPKEFHQLKYEAISVPQGSVRLVKKTQERKNSTCYLLITKGVTNSSPVPLKTRRRLARTSPAIVFVLEHESASWARGGVIPTGVLVGAQQKAAYPALACFRFRSKERVQKKGRR